MESATVVHYITFPISILILQYEARGGAVG
jgi:hypothetical protein